MERIRTELPEVALVDEDYGQAQAPGRLGAGQLPCVLVAGPATEWTAQSALQPAVQRGTATLTVKLVFDCTADVPAGATAAERVRWREELGSRLYRAVLGFAPARRTSPLVRTASGEELSGDGRKVYTTTFRFSEMVSE